MIRPRPAFRSGRRRDDQVRLVLLADGLAELDEAERVAAARQWLRRAAPVGFTASRPRVEVLFPGAPRRDDPFRLGDHLVVSYRASGGVSAFDVAAELSAALGVPVQPALRSGSYAAMSPLSGGDCDTRRPGDLAWHLRATRVPQAWSVAGTGAGQVVGHLDTGWLPHPQLDPAALDLSRQFDTLGVELDPPRWEDPRDARDRSTWLDLFHGHGLATASVLAARGALTVPGTPGRGGAVCGTSSPGVELRGWASPAADVVGAAPAATLLPVRCTDSVLLVGDVEVARAIWYAARQDVAVMSISLGGTPAPWIHAAVGYAVHVGNILICAAAGNYVPFVVHPAAYPEVLAVAGSTFEDAPWPGSARGPQVAVSAPAECVWHADIDASGPLVRAGDGTSFATPQVAAAAALWLSHHGRGSLLDRYPSSSLFRVFRACLTSSARRPPGWPAGYGAGILDVAALLATPLPDPATLPDDRQARLDAWFGADPVAFLAEHLDGLPTVVRTALHDLVAGGTGLDGRELLTLIQGHRSVFDVLFSPAPPQTADGVRDVLARVVDEMSSALKRLFGLG